MPAQASIESIRIELVQTEILGTTTSTGHQTAEHPKSSRVIKSLEIVDGCGERGDVIKWRMSVRGTAGLGPTLKNVENRFNVKYSLRLVVREYEGTEMKMEEYEIFIEKGQ